LARHKRFRALGAEEQDLVMDVASETLKSVLFGVMIILDGLSGGNPIQDTTSDFALELRTYTSDAARTSDQPVASVRINPPSSTRPLHDLLLWRLEEEDEEE